MKFYAVMNSQSPWYMVGDADFVTFCIEEAENNLIATYSEMTAEQRKKLTDEEDRLDIMVFDTRDDSIPDGMDAEALYDYMWDNDLTWKWSHSEFIEYYDLIYDPIEVTAQ